MVHIYHQYGASNITGEGSFGKVYQARRRAGAQYVALKVIPKAGKTPEELHALHSEIGILHQLQHPHIIGLDEAFEIDHAVVVVMEYAHSDMYRAIAKAKVLPLPTIRRAAAQIASALEYLHVSHRIIHRDLKPQNVLLDAHGNVKLADFGFARLLTSATQVLHSVKGTPLYMAPELVQEQGYDHRVDLWSLGVILYELTTGTAPFPTSSMYALVAAIVNSEIHWPSAMDPALQDFLAQLLAKDPAARLTWPHVQQHPFLAGALSPHEPTPTADTFLQVSCTVRVEAWAAVQAWCADPANAGQPIPPGITQGLWNPGAATSIGSLSSRLPVPPDDAAVMRPPSVRSHSGSTVPGGDLDLEATPRYPPLPDSQSEIGTEVSRSHSEVDSSAPVSVAGSASVASNGGASLQPVTAPQEQTSVHSEEKGTARASQSMSDEALQEEGVPDTVTSTEAPPATDHAEVTEVAELAGLSDASVSTVEAANTLLELSGLDAPFGADTAPASAQQSDDETPAPPVDEPDQPRCESVAEGAVSSSGDGEGPSEPDIGEAGEAAQTAAAASDDAGASAILAPDASGAPSTPEAASHTSSDDETAQDVPSVTENQGNQPAGSDALSSAHSVLSPAHSSHSSSNSGDETGLGEWSNSYSRSYGALSSPQAARPNSAQLSGAHRRAMSSSSSDSACSSKAPTHNRALGAPDSFASSAGQADLRSHAIAPVSPVSASNALSPSIPSSPLRLVSPLPSHSSQASTSAASLGSSASSGAGQVRATDPSIPPRAEHSPVYSPCQHESTPGKSRADSDAGSVSGCSVHSSNQALSPQPAPGGTPSEHDTALHPGHAGSVHGFESSADGAEQSDWDSTLSPDSADKASPLYSPQEASALLSAVSGANGIALDGFDEQAKALSQREPAEHYSPAIGAVQPSAQLSPATPEHHGRPASAASHSPAYSHGSPVHTAAELGLSTPPRVHRSMLSAQGSPASASFSDNTASQSLTDRMASPALARLRARAAHSAATPQRSPAAVDTPAPLQPRTAVGTAAAQYTLPGLLQLPLSTWMGSASEMPEALPLLRWPAITAVHHIAPRHVLASLCALLHRGSLADTQLCAIAHLNTMAEYGGLLLLGTPSDAAHTAWSADVLEDAQLALAEAVVEVFKSLPRSSTSRQSASPDYAIATLAAQTRAASAFSALASLACGMLACTAHAKRSWRALLGWQPDTELLPEPVRQAQEQALRALLSHTHALKQHAPSILRAVNSALPVLASLQRVAFHALENVWSNAATLSAAQALHSAVCASICTALLCRQQVRALRPLFSSATARSLAESGGIEWRQACEEVRLHLAAVSGIPDLDAQIKRPSQLAAVVLGVQTGVASDDWQALVSQVLSSHGIATDVCDEPSLEELVLLASVVLQAFDVGADPAAFIHATAQKLPQPAVAVLGILQAAVTAATGRASTDDHGNVRRVWSDAMWLALCDAVELAASAHTVPSVLAGMLNQALAAPRAAQLEMVLKRKARGADIAQRWLHALYSTAVQDKGSSRTATHIALAEALCAVAAAIDGLGSRCEPAITAAIASGIWLELLAAGFHSTSATIHQATLRCVAAWSKALPLTLSQGAALWPHMVPVCREVLHGTHLGSMKWALLACGNAAFADAAVAAQMTCLLPEVVDITGRAVDSIGIRTDTPDDMDRVTLNAVGVMSNIARHGAKAMPSLEKHGALDMLVNVACRVHAPALRAAVGAAMFGLGNVAHCAVGAQWLLAAQHAGGSFHVMAAVQAAAEVDDAQLQAYAARLLKSLAKFH